MARQLERQFKQPFVVENRVGGNSFIGAQLVAKAPPDGYTLYWTSNSAMTTNLIAFKQLPYHPVDDFALRTDENDIVLNTQRGEQAVLG